MVNPTQGKTEMGYFIAKAIKEELKRDPVLVRNVDLTAKGAVFDDFTDIRIAHTPSVLVVNEYDVAVRTADGLVERKGDKGETSSLADNKASLTNLLDRMERTRFLVLLATTNDTSLMTDDRFKPYVRL